MSDLYRTETAVSSNGTGIVDDRFGNNVTIDVIDDSSLYGTFCAEPDLSYPVEPMSNELSSLLNQFASGNWNELCQAREKIRAKFETSVYRSAARSASANTHVHFAMLDLICEDEFEMDWAKTDEHVYIFLCRSIALRSRNSEAREGALYEALKSIGLYLTRLHCKKPYLQKQRIIEKDKLQFLIDLSLPGSPCRLMILNRLVEYANFGPGHLSKANARVGLKTIAMRDGIAHLQHELFSGNVEEQYLATRLLAACKTRKAVAPLLYGLLEVQNDRILKLIRSILNEQYAHVYKLVVRELITKDARFKSLVV